MKHSKRSEALILCLQIGTALLFGGFMYCQTRLISGLEAQAVYSGTFGLTVLFLLAYILLEAAENYVREREAAAYAARTKQSAARAFLFQSMAAHTEKSEEQHISFFSNEIDAVLEQNFYIRLYTQKEFVMMCASLLTLFVVAKACSLAVVCAAVCFGAVIQRLSGRMTGKQREVLSKKSAFVERLMELHQGFDEIHINQMEALAERDFNQANQAVEQALYRFRLSRMRLSLLSVGQTMMIYTLILIVGGVLASRGLVGLGIFVSAAELSAQALGEWSMVTRLYTLVRSSKPLREELEAYTGQPEAPFRQPGESGGDVLVDLRGVCFAYEENAPLWKDVNLSIRRGKKYLITGESGSGKSTLLEVLVGHKPCGAGEIRYFTDKIAYLPQTPFLFAGTLRENLCLGRSLEDAALLEMLGKVGLSLPLDTQITGQGGNLSGGQKARVALARALLTEPDLLVADELTANLDPDLGRQLEERLFQEYPQMALCMTAHKTYCRACYDGILPVGRTESCEVIG